MEIVESTSGAVGILTATGPLVGGDARIFRDAALDASIRRRGRIVLDAAAIPFADSDGLEALLDVTDALGASGRAFKICCASETLRETLAITGVAGHFELYDDVQSAVRSHL
jgi:anti-anti-sigma factor